MTSQKALDAILQASSDAIVATDRAGIITFWNPGATRIFGFEDSEAVGQSLDIIVPENLRKRHWDGFHQTMATGRAGTATGTFYPFQP
jgi:PAS domain S-box-containing protein